MQPGWIVLLGSGETSASGRKAFDWLFRRLKAPVRVAVLETPAGFELNSAWVAEQVASFLRHRLQNYQPEVTVVPARRRGTPFSPDEPGIVAPLLSADVIFLGPGSPTYAVRQLRASLAWHTLLARHRLGASLALASAAVIAVGAYALPVYEIYKAGADLHWVPGLDLLGAYGLALVLVPHWNNQEGGARLDTSRCFMGQERFEQLLQLLPGTVTVLGIDEHTALAVNLAEAVCYVLGNGSVTWLRAGSQAGAASGQCFSLSELGELRMPDVQAGIPEDVWEWVQAGPALQPAAPELSPPAQVLELVSQRAAARARRDWAQADALRGQIEALGWQVLDTPEGPVVKPKEKST